MKYHDLNNGLEKDKENNSFPVRVLPKKLKRLIHDLETGYKYPTDFIATSLLGAASIAVGNKHVLKVTNSWEERAVFFFVLVGSPGTNKSHPLSFAMKPLRNEYKIQYEQYKHQMDEYKLLPNDKTITCAERPVLKRYYLNNATIEKYFEVHAQNPNGIGIYTDEFASLLNTLAKYNKGGGSDTPLLLSIWSGKEITYDRKNTLESLYISDPYTPIIGTSQPNIIKELMSKESRDNGFMDRVLLAYPGKLHIPYMDFKNEAIHAEDDWEEIIIAILEQRDDEVIYQLSDNAEKVYLDYTDRNTDIMNASDNDYYKGLISKMNIYCFRFALLIEEINYAIKTFNQTVEVIEPTRSITEESMKAARTICEYFVKTGLKFRNRISIISPFESLPESHQDLYKKLPDEFQSKEAIDIGTSLDISKSTINRFLTNHEFFTKVRRGIYTKSKKNS